MSAEAAEIAVVLDRIGRGVIETLAGVPDDVLNRELQLPETNSLFALATHLAGAGEFWVLALAGGLTVARDRDAEFTATGTGASLVSRYDRWLRSVHDVLDTMPADRLDRTVEPPAAYRGSLSEEATVRECLLHAVEHSALHQGQIEITRQRLMQ